MHDRHDIPAGRPGDGAAGLPPGAVDAFRRDGYLVLPGFADPEQVAALRGLAVAHLDPLLGPAEYEADVRYPGAPPSRTAPGGNTPRRLLHACARDARLRAWATSAPLGAALRAVMGTGDVCLSQCHHNCIMTKHPTHSSQTGWHQDVRYWAFERPELVSAWLALGAEQVENGALRVLPGSHHWTVRPEQLDAAKFLRTDLAANQPLLATARPVELAAGDVLLFHCGLFHAAGANRTAQVKLSAVFTYHAADNAPLAATRSALYPSLPMTRDR